jgi:ATP-dependent helicase HrpB
MNAPRTPRLPVTTALPELAAALSRTGLAVLQAPPGAGKSTGVPLALLDAPWLAGQRMLVLEPRRLAARAVANRMASLLGESVGETVGYRMRLDTKVGPRTRIEVVTEGILTRQLQRDPALDGVGMVIFDEFHERSLQADLGLALTLDVRRQLRPELRLLLMSATLDGEAVSRLLDDAPLVSAPGLSFPVETRYAERESSEYLDRQLAAAIHRALRDDAGDLLVFLPGAGEIRRVECLLAGKVAAQLHPLYGDLPREAQERAILPATDGQRKVVLATNIAETSLTIEGVRVVIDAGLERRNLFDPRSGMNRLETVPISVASADQRRGRAGRLAPGVCYRLWTEARQRSLATHTPAEIVNADLAPLALELACWGTRDPAALAWLTPPAAGPLAQARELLQTLGALDGETRITAHGREMHRLGTHPRLAHLLLCAQQAGVASTGCALAALLGERDILRSRPNERDADLRTRLELLARESDASGHPDADRHALRQVQRSAESFARQLGLRGKPVSIDMHEAGWLLASAYPDRIARARAPGSGRYQLSNGRGACFAEAQSLANSEFLVIADLDAGQREARIFAAAPLTIDELDRHFGEAIQDVLRVYWDEREQAVLTRRQRRLGELIIEDAAIRDPDSAQIAAAMLDGIRSMGLDALPWTAELRQWQARLLLSRAAQPDATPPWPDVGDAALLATLDDWLLPWLDGVARRAHLVRLDLRAALHGLLTWQQQQQLDTFAPTHLEVPSGSRIAIDYLDGPVPSLSVRLQEVFGLRETPRIAGGQISVLLKLLSPARRPVQVTRDLESFWKTAYHEVRRELKGRYPKHYWPEDPHQAEPTRRARPPASGVKFRP